LTEAEVATYKV